MNRSTALLVVCVLVGVACSRQADQIDTKKVEDQIRTTLTKTYDDDRVTDVTCPDDVKLAQGVNFDCTAKVDGEPVRFAVEQVDDQGTVDFALTEAVVDVGTLQARIEDQYDKDAGRAVSATCGETTVLVVKFNEAINCTVEDDAGTAESVVVSVSKDGVLTLTSPTIGGPGTDS